MKKVVYLGGYYPAEQSIHRSFTDHGVDIMFPYDAVPRYPITYEKRSGKKSRSSHRSVIESKDYGDPLPETGFMMQSIPDHVVYVPQKNLLSWIVDYNPSVIIHRYYLDSFYMHSNAREVALKLGIPYVAYRMETLPTDGYMINPIDCDLFLYANKCDEHLINQKKDWWCWGVSEYERNLGMPRNTDLAAFGLVGHNSNAKHENLSFFINAAKRVDRKIYVYWGMATELWANIAREIFVQPAYTLEDQTEKMNACKIAINYETVAGIPGCWSYKIWQTMGCGTPTITMKKPEYKEMFDDALREVTCESDAAYEMNGLLEDPLYWDYISRKSEEIVHDKYEWFTNFDKIMRKNNLW